MPKTLISGIEASAKTPAQLAVQLKALHYQYILSRVIPILKTSSAWGISIEPGAGRGGNLARPVLNPRKSASQRPRSHVARFGEGVDWLADQGNGWL